MKKCAVISGGEFSRGLVPSDYDYIIACDKGYQYALEMNITPDLVVGDFDSYSGAIKEGIPVKRYKCEKDDTDTMLAVKIAIDRGYSAIDIFCALGGRFDHTFANIQSAVYGIQKGAKVSIIADDTLIYFLKDSKISIPRRDGFSLSIFSIGDVSQGVSISGAKYSLENADITNSFPVGTSNQWASEVANIEVKSGILMIVLSAKEV